MIQLYTLPSNQSSRKAIAFFEEHGLPFRIIKMNMQLTFGDVVYLAKRADGIGNIITRQSKFHEEYEELANNEETTLYQLYYFVLKNPRILKAPLILDDKRFEIGFNEENIRTFLPRSTKKQLYVHQISEARKNGHMKSFAEEVKEEVEEECI